LAFTAALSVHTEHHSQHPVYRSGLTERFIAKPSGKGARRHRAMIQPFFNLIRASGSILYLSPHGDKLIHLTPPYHIPPFQVPNGCKTTALMIKKQGWQSRAEGPPEFRLQLVFRCS
jgi:hypothetical protein